MAPPSDKEMLEEAKKVLEDPNGPLTPSKRAAILLANALGHPEIGREFLEKWKKFNSPSK